jgi:hypothetical protein
MQPTPEQQDQDRRVMGHFVFPADDRRCTSTLTRQVPWIAFCLLRPQVTATGAARTIEVIHAG